MQLYRPFFMLKPLCDANHIFHDMYQFGSNISHTRYIR